MNHEKTLSFIKKIDDQLRQSGYEVLLVSGRVTDTRDKLSLGMGKFRRKPYPQPGKKVEPIEYTIAREAYAIEVADAAFLMALANATKHPDHTKIDSGAGFHIEPMANGDPYLVLLSPDPARLKPQRGRIFLVSSEGWTPYDSYKPNARGYVLQRPAVFIHEQPDTVPILGEITIKWDDIEHPVMWHPDGREAFYADEARHELNPNLGADSYC